MQDQGRNTRDLALMKPTPKIPGFADLLGKRYVIGPSGDPFPVADVLERWDKYDGRQNKN